MREDSLLVSLRREELDRSHIHHYRNADTSTKKPASYADSRLATSDAMGERRIAMESPWSATELYGEVVFYKLTTSLAIGEVRYVLEEELLCKSG